MIDEKAKSSKATSRFAMSTVAKKAIFGLSDLSRMSFQG